MHSPFQRARNHDRDYLTCHVYTFIIVYIISFETSLHCKNSVNVCMVKHQEIYSYHLSNELS